MVGKLCRVEKKTESKAVSWKNFRSRLCTNFELFLKKKIVYLVASVISVSLNNATLVSFNSIHDSAISLLSGRKVRGWRITLLPILVHWLTTLDIENSLLYLRSICLRLCTFIHGWTGPVYKLSSVILRDTELLPHRVHN